MTIVLKILRIALIALLSFVLIITAFFVVDRYLLHPTMKGISPVDMKHILIYLVVPLSLLIVIVRFIERKRKK